MALTLDGVLLGLGTVVRLEIEQADGLFVVLARGAFRADPEGAVVQARYLVGPHPYGEAPDQETFPILASEISEVVFPGYTDEADEVFLADLLDQMENGRRPTTPAVQFTDELTELPERAARNGGADEGESDGGDGGVDPFHMVRRLLGQNDRKVEQ